MVRRRVLARPDAAAVHAREVAERVDEREHDGALLGGQADGAAGPGQHEGQGGPDARGDEADHDVANDGGLHGGADDGAREADAERDGDVPAALDVAVGRPCDDVEADGGDGVDGHCHVLRGDGVVAEGEGDGGDEVGDGAGADVEHEEDEEHPGARIRDGGDEGLPVREALRALRAGGDAVGDDADRGELALGGGELLRGGGVVEEDEEGEEGDADGGYALDDEEPAPACDAVRVVEVCGDCAGEESAESWEGLARRSILGVIGAAYLQIELRQCRRWQIVCPAQPLCTSS